MKLFSHSRPRLLAWSSLYQLCCELWIVNCELWTRWHFCNSQFTIHNKVCIGWRKDTNFVVNCELWIVNCESGLQHHFHPSSSLYQLCCELWIVNCKNATWFTIHNPQFTIHNKVGIGWWRQSRLSMRKNKSRKMMREVKEKQRLCRRLCTSNYWGSCTKLVSLG